MSAATTLGAVLSATGFLLEGRPAPGVLLGEEARRGRRRRSFEPDAVWRAQNQLTVYFKSVDQDAPSDLLSAWRREVWNEGFTPLLWVISPRRIDLYNGFEEPAEHENATVSRLRNFQNVDAELRELDAFAGRLALETGAFWLNAPEVSRRASVDHRLLKDLGALEQNLVASSVERTAAQAIIGRSVFTQYLIDRHIVSAELLKSICGAKTLSAALRDSASTKILFQWLAQTFNGDMFPPDSVMTSPSVNQLAHIADFLEAKDPVTGQLSLFPYQFDVIPVELISSIYERFVHAASPASVERHGATEASTGGVYYTRLPLVSLILDEVMDGLEGRETVADLTCGSGVFLVEALRRLVSLRGQREPQTRALIRNALYTQIFGVDISEAAIRVAAFSLYLAALELDPDPEPPEALRFEPLIGRSLFVGDAHTIDREPEAAAILRPNDVLRTFDVIVGNPPWSFKGKGGTAARRHVIDNKKSPAQPRGEGFDFVLRTLDFAHDRTRFGMVVSALPFFAASRTGAAAARHIVNRLSPVTLVNLSQLSDWLFPNADMPAALLLARHRLQPSDRLTIIQVPWSPVGARAHTFDIAPSHVATLRLEDWKAVPVRLKAAAFGRRRDLALLNSLIEDQRPLSEGLLSLGVELKDGLVRGAPFNRTRDAGAMGGLEVLDVKSLTPFKTPDKLSLLDLDRAQWPRTRERYRAPLLLVKEFFASSPRAVAAVADRDLVYMHGIYGAPFKPEDIDIARMLSGILSSSLAAWFYIMTAAEFGIFKRRLLVQDVARMPTPPLRVAVRSRAGIRIVELVKEFAAYGTAEDTLAALDDAVFELYKLDSAENQVVADGLQLGSAEWRAGRIALAEPANTIDLEKYAYSFMSVVDRWLATSGRRRIRGEVIEPATRDSLRTIRFLLEDGRGPSYIERVKPAEDLTQVLDRIGQRLHVPITEHVVAGRELRIHGLGEIIIVKPAPRRYWMPSAALEDADTVLVESFTAAVA